MNNETEDKAQQSFSRAFLHALVGAMTAATGSPWLAATLPDAPAAPDGSPDESPDKSPGEARDAFEDEAGPVRIHLTLAGSLPGAFLLEFNGADAAMLAAKCLQKPVAAFGEQQSQALLKVIEAAIEAFRSTQAPDYGSFTIDLALTSDPLSDQAAVAEIAAADGDSNRVSMRMYLNLALAEALSLHVAPANSGAETANSADPPAAKETKAIPEQVNLDLVMDVELNVTLRFGQRQLTLREVLELTSGSVIELDRQVEEPVELLLEGKVIARGEAVVIDGNYGLRVTEVPRPISSAVLR